MSEATAAIQGLNNSELFDSENKLRVRLSRDRRENTNPEIRYADDGPRREGETWDYADAANDTGGELQERSARQEVPEFRDARNESTTRTVEKYVSTIQWFPSEKFGVRVVLSGLMVMGGVLFLVGANFFLNRSRVYARP